MFWIVTVINIICIISIIYIERKRPQETIAWVLVITFLPIIGIFLYILLGNTVIPPLSRRVKRHYKEYNRYVESFGQYLKLNKEDILNENNKNIIKYKDLIMLNSNNNLSIFSNDNKITLFTDAYEKYIALFNDIKNAKKSVNLEYFIIRNDETGRELVKLLAKKAKEGIKVNILYDELGSLYTTMKMFKPVRDAGGDVLRFFNSIGSNLLRFNNRNHRKIVVIDGKTGYLGGMNIGKEYMGLGKLTPWRDTHLKIEGSAVYSLQVRFLLDYIFSKYRHITDIDSEKYNIYFPEYEFTGDKCIQIVTSGPDSKKEEIKCTYIKMINIAKKNIYIQTPYFVPDSTMMECLKLAALSGIDVNLMIPGKPDKQYVYYITLSHIEELLECGVKVYLYNGFLHSKTIVTDSEVTSVGSTNFDVRSFTLNYEINAVIYDMEFATENIKVFNKDAKNSKLLTLSEFRKRGFLKKMAEKILKLFSPLA